MNGGRRAMSKTGIRNHNRWERSRYTQRGEPMRVKKGQKKGNGDSTRQIQRETRKQNGWWWTGKGSRRHWLRMGETCQCKGREGPRVGCRVGGDRGGGTSGVDDTGEVGAVDCPSSDVRNRGGGPAQSVVLSRDHQRDDEREGDGGWKIQTQGR